MQAEHHTHSFFGFDWKKILKKVKKKCKKHKITNFRVPLTLISCSWEPKGVFQSCCTKTSEFCTATLNYEAIQVLELSGTTKKCSSYRQTSPASQQLFSDSLRSKSWHRENNDIVVYIAYVVRGTGRWCWTIEFLFFKIVQVYAGAKGSQRYQVWLVWEQFWAILPGCWELNTGPLQE